MRLTLTQLKQIIQEELDADLNEIGRTLPEWNQWLGRASELLEIFAQEVGNREFALQAMAEAIRLARREPGDEVPLEEKCGPEHADE